MANECIRVIKNCSVSEKGNATDGPVTLKYKIETDGKAGKEITKVYTKKDAFSFPAGLQCATWLAALTASGNKVQCK